MLLLNDLDSFQICLKSFQAFVFDMNPLIYVIFIL